MIAFVSSHSQSNCTHSIDAREQEREVKLQDTSYDTTIEARFVLIHPVDLLLFALEL